MNDANKKNAAAIMKRNGKSFWFASLFLPRQTASDAARLYAFCRRMDDLADVAVTEANRAVLSEVRDDLRRGVSSKAFVKDFLALAQQYNLPREAADYLIAAFLEDATHPLNLEDENQLVRYCYGVAGTVGLMMSPILGADRQRAAGAAVHLGIAMQMTNIARDVLEDAKNGRRYLPGCWVEHKGAEEILVSYESRQQVSVAIARLLELADRFYASAALGFPLIPRRARTGIEIAAAVYREIGIVLRRKQYAWWDGRATVSPSRKLWIALRVCLGGPYLSRMATESRIPELSRPLAGLPGAP